MADQTLIDTLRAGGHLNADHLSRWQDAAGLMAVLDAIGREGVSAVVKIDGERAKESVYTVVISGPLLGDAFFRKDGSDLVALLREAVDFYRAEVWR